MRSPLPESCVPGRQPDGAMLSRTVTRLAHYIAALVVAREGGTEDST
jgi:hypothetical protein